MIRSKTIRLPPRDRTEPPMCELWTVPQLLTVAAVILALFFPLIVAWPNV